jgi:hypothetical protein
MRHLGEIENTITLMRGMHTMTGLGNARDGVLDGLGEIENTKTMKGRTHTMTTTGAHTRRP